MKKSRPTTSVFFSDVRNALGRDKVVSAAAGFFGNGFDMREAMKYLDYVNLMTYDMGWQAPHHHTALRRSGAWPEFRRLRSQSTLS